MRTLRSTVVIGSLVALIGILLGDDRYWIDAPQVNALRWAGAGLALLGLVVFVGFFSAVSAPKKTAPGKPIAQLPTKTEVHEALNEVTRSYDPETINFFVNMLIDFKQHLVRINEEVAVEDGSLLRLKARQQYDVAAARSDDPSKSPKTLLVPLLRPQKGVLLDVFSVTNAAGDEVPTLVFTRVRGLLAYCLMALFTMAEQQLSRDIVEEAHRSSQKTLGELIMAICGPGPLHRQPVDRRERIEGVLEKIEDLPFTNPWKERIRLFCSHHIDYYVVVAEVPMPVENQLVVTYSYRTHYSPVIDKKNRWRSRFGLTPSIIDIPLNAYAFQVPSYHLQVSCDAGQYVYNHYLARLHSDEPVSQEKLQAQGFTPYVRVYYNEGRPNAHLYIRQQGDTSATTSPRLKTIIQFREIPPGVLGGAMIVAAASTTLISFFALTHLGLGIELSDEFSPKDQLTATLNSDIPALLLALPAFTAALMGSWSDLSRLRRASLITYIGLLGTMALSIFSALYLVYDANHKLATETVVRPIWGGEITTEKVWLALMLLSWMLTLTLLRQLISELRHYSHTAR